MSVFESPDYVDHEQVVFVGEPDVGLRAIIAVHSTALGPALGGCRIWPYETEAEAISDVLRLSRGMTYKGATARVKLGGGKAVIIADPEKDKRPEFLHAMGRWIERMNGRYITGEDIGSNPHDMAEIRKETRYVTCLREEDGGYGDPAPMTALGVFCAIRAGLEQEFASPGFGNIKVAVQGVGNVGYRLCQLLAEAGARLVVSDLLEKNLHRAVTDFEATVVDPTAIYDADVDVFAPCAMGGILNDQTIPHLKAKVIAGGANNQLAEARHGEALARRGITYLPDYVANGGGLIHVAADWYQEDPAQIAGDVRRIYDSCVDVLNLAKADGISTSLAADKLAEGRLLAGQGQPGPDQDNQNE